MNINRKIELLLVGELRARLPVGTRVEPQKADEELEPPFCVVMCDDAAEEGVPGLWTAEVRVAWVTHFKESTAANHAEMVRRIGESLREIPAGYRTALDVNLHGLDMEGQQALDRPDGKAHADVVIVKVGVSG